MKIYKRLGNSANELEREKFEKEINKLDTKYLQLIKDLFIKYKLDDIYTSSTEQELEILKSIEDICSNLKISLEDFKEKFLLLLEREENDRKRLACAYYTEDIQERVWEIMY